MARKTGNQAALPLRVLGSLEDGTWTAHCLETDLIGIGSSFDVAMKALQEATTSQLEFALAQGQPKMFYRPAPNTVFETYARVLAERLERWDESAVDPTRTVTTFPLPIAGKGNFASVREGD